MSDDSYVVSRYGLRAMAYFYFDESIHRADGFILGSWVCFNDDPSEQVGVCLTNAGLVPRIDEFKSSSRMDANEAQSRAREELRRIVGNGKLALVVVPEARRKDLGLEALAALDRVLAANEIHGPHEVFIDQGIVGHREKFFAEARRLDLDRRCTIHIEEDSVLVMGLQLADLAAHSCATMLRGQLGRVTKVIQVENAGYDGMDLELDFYLWATLRGCLFATRPAEDPVSGDINFTVDVISMGGLHVATDCREEIRDAAVRTFGSDYLGCIH